MPLGSMNPISLRPAVVADAPAVAILTTQLGYPVSPTETSARIDELGQRSDQLLLVAEHNGVVVGWLQIHTYVTLEFGHQAEIIGLVVSETQRRGGTGRALVLAAERWARSGGAKSITVGSNIVRTESHSFYLALGFEPTKTQAIYRKAVVPPGID